MRRASRWRSARGSRRTAPRAAKLSVKAVITFDKGDAGWKIARSDITVRGDVPGIDAATFTALAEDARDNCPVSVALKGNVELAVDARSWRLTRPGRRSPSRTTGGTSPASTTRASRSTPSEVAPGVCALLEPVRRGAVGWSWSSGAGQRAAHPGADRRGTSHASRPTPRRRCSTWPARSRRAPTTTEVLALPDDPAARRRTRSWASGHPISYLPSLGGDPRGAGGHGRRAAAGRRCSRSTCATSTTGRSARRPGEPRLGSRLTTGR